MTNQCVICGAEMPEGDQVCKECARGTRSIKVKPCPYCKNPPTVERFIHKYDAAAIWCHGCNVGVFGPDINHAVRVWNEEINQDEQVRRA